MIAEQQAGTFSPEEAPNVTIPCSFSSTFYELEINFKSLLGSNPKSPNLNTRQHRIKLYDLFSVIASYQPSFFVSNNRFCDLIEPHISFAAK